MTIFYCLKKKNKHTFTQDTSDDLFNEPYYFIF